MVARRFFGIFGELIAGGDIPTGIGSTAYVAGSPGTGDWTLANNDDDKLWPTRHVANNYPFGVLAYIWNLIGAGTVANPQQSLDQYRGPLIGSTPFQQNGHTDPWNGGKFPSEWAGIEQEFLLRQHGYPSDAAVGNALSRDPTFTVKKGQLNATMIPSEEFRGTIVALTDSGSNTVEVTLSATHGQTAGSTFTCWIYGLYPVGTTTPDPQLTAKHTATAHATDPLKFSITLASAWTGVGGVSGTGVCVVPRYRVTGVSNPSGNLVRLVLSAAIEGSVGMFSAFVPWSLSQIWVDGITGTTSVVDGHWTNTQNSLAFHKPASASTSISFTSGTKTIALASGSWTRTPVAGERIAITGSASNNKTVTVASATSTTIVVTETLTTESAGSAVTLSNLNVVEFNYGAAVNVAGWSSGGCLFRCDPMHPVYSGSFNGWALFDRIVRYSTNINNIGRALLDAFPGGFFIGDTIGDEDSAVLLCCGYNDSWNAEAGSGLQSALVTTWSQLLVELVTAIRAALSTALSGAPDPTDIPVILVRCQPDQEAVSWNADWSPVSIAAVQWGEQIAAARLDRFALLDWADLPKRNAGVWPTASTVIELGRRAYELQQSLSAGVDTTPTSGPLPIYFLIGDSNMQGAVSNSVTFPQGVGGDPDYDGSWYDAGYVTVNRARGCLIWNPQANAGQEYAPGLNANKYPASLGLRWPTAITGQTLGHGLGTVGPEASWFLKSRKRHDEGVLAFKLGVGGSTAVPWTTERPTWDPAGGDLYQDLLSEWERIQDWCREARRYLDMRGVAIMIGTNDALDDDATLLFEARLRALIAALRADFTTTSSSRDPLPIVLIEPPTSDRMGATLQDNLPTIVAACRAIAADTDNVVSKPIQGVPTQTDGVHYTWHGSIAVGEAIDEAFGQTSIGTDGPETGTGSKLNPDLGHALSGGTGSSVAGATAADSGADLTTASVAGSSASAATAVSSASTLLDLVNAAIATFLGNGAVQEYSINGRTVKRSQLSELMATQAQLRAQIAGGSGGRTFARRARI